MATIRSATLCVAQQKGGVCKTTSVLSLSAAWAQAGKAVLMIDADPQANLTRNILDYERIGTDISALYRGNVDPGELVTETAYENLFVMPARTALNRVENLERTLGTYMALKSAIPKLSKRFPFIVIDTPPSLGLFTVSALLAATHVLVPVQPTFFCEEGLGDLNATISEAREGNEGLRSVRYFVTLYDKRTVIGQELVSTLRDKLGDKVFKTVIRKNVAVEESQYAQKTIYDYAPRSAGAVDFGKLAKEVRGWLEST